MALILDGTNGVSGVNGTASTPALQGTDSNTGITFGTDTVTINTGGTARVTTDASGNVGIGVTPSAWGSPFKPIQIATNGQYIAGQTNSPDLKIGTNHYYNGSNYVYTVTGSTASRFDVGASTSAGFAWQIAPSGTAGNAISFTQAMTLDASGNLLVGTTSPILSGKISVAGRISIQNNAGDCFVINATGATNTGYVFDGSGTGTRQAAYFLINGGNVGRIECSTTATSYATASDYRLKENVALMQNALATVAALKPCTYTWKVDGSAGQGFIAHELQEVVPDCVTGTKDAVDKDGKPQYQGVDTSFLVGILTKAIQEQQTIIQNLTARLEALEAK